MRVRWKMVNESISRFDFLASNRIWKSKTNENNVQHTRRCTQDVAFNAHGFQKNTIQWTFSNIDHLWHRPPSFRRRSLRRFADPWRVLNTIDPGEPIFTRDIDRLCSLRARKNTTGKSRVHARSGRALSTGGACARGVSRVYTRLILIFYIDRYQFPVHCVSFSSHDFHFFFSFWFLERAGTRAKLLHYRGANTEHSSIRFVFFFFLIYLPFLLFFFFFFT